MPDWVIHIGAGYLLARIIDKEEVSLALVGAILPDVISRFEGIMIDFFHLYIFENYSFGCFHTPFMLACMSLAIALFTVRPGRAFSVVFGMCLLHIFLDMLEVHVPGVGVLLFWPISYQPYSFDIFYFKGIGYLLVYGLFLLVLLSALIQKRSIPKIRWTKKHLSWALPVIIFVFMFPFYASPLMYEHNVGDVQFLNNPKDWDGKKVSLHVSRVISSNPVVVEEREHRFELVTEQKFQVGDWISVYGTYRKGKITPEITIRETGTYQKSFLSGMGLLFLIAFFIM